MRPIDVFPGGGRGGKGGRFCGGIFVGAFCGAKVLWEHFVGLDFCGSNALKMKRIVLKRTKTIIFRPCGALNRVNPTKIVDFLWELFLGTFSGNFFPPSDLKSAPGKTSMHTSC